MDATIKVFTTDSGVNLLSPKQTISDRARAAACWFLRSGIQDPGGGVARYYRGDLGCNARISTEITGYAASTLVYLFERTGDEACLDGARRAAGFLVHTAWDPALQVFPFEYSTNGDTPELLAWFFDSGIIVRGLLAVARATGDDRYMEAAIRGGESMRAHVDGVIHPILSLPSLKPVPHTRQWSRAPGCYQLKSAMAWHELHVATGVSRYLEWYEEALALALATRDSFLPAETQEKTVDRLHAWLYFLEGLLPAGNRRGLQRELERGIARTSDYLSQAGCGFERSDVYAQLLRVRLLAADITGAPLSEDDAAREAQQIIAFQVGDGDVRVRGGYAFGRRDGELIPHMNPVSTAFCAQALQMWEDHRAGKRLSPLSLI